MKEFVEYIVKNLVDNPDKVYINEIGGTHTLIIELGVEKSDIGKNHRKKRENDQCDPHSSHVRCKS